MKKHIFLVICAVGVFGDSEPCHAWGNPIKWMGRKVGLVSGPRTDPNTHYAARRKGGFKTAYRYFKNKAMPSCYSRRMNQLPYAVSCLKQSVPNLDNGKIFVQNDDGSLKSFQVNRRTFKEKEYIEGFKLADRAEQLRESLDALWEKIQTAQKNIEDAEASGDQNGNFIDRLRGKSPAQVIAANVAKLDVYYEMYKALANELTSIEEQWKRLQGKLGNKVQLDNPATIDLAPYKAGDLEAPGGSVEVPTTEISRPDATDPIYSPTTYVQSPKFLPETVAQFQDFVRKNPEGMKTICYSLFSNGGYFKDYVRRGNTGYPSKDDIKNFKNVRMIQTSRRANDFGNYDRLWASFCDEVRVFGALSGFSTRAEVGQAPKTNNNKSII